MENQSDFAHVYSKTFQSRETNQEGSDETDQNAGLVRKRHRVVEVVVGWRSKDGDELGIVAGRPHGSGCLRVLTGHGCWLRA